MADDNKNDPIMWILGGIAALLGIAGLAAMNKPAGGSGTTTVTDAPKKAGCGCNAHS